MITKGEEKLVGRGTWIDKVAYNLVLREKKLGRKVDLIRVESGLGASGIPHIGSMGDAVRAYGIALALQNLGYKSELIAYSDDMDGLRKVPSDLPDILIDDLAKPVSAISDPFGSCHSSYGAHMSSLLLEGLDRLGIKYKFQSGTSVYMNGLLSNQIDTILQNSSRLGRKIAEYVGQQKYNETLPYFPICENCCRLYVARAEKYIQAEKKVSYTCSGSRIGNERILGCGYTGEVDIREGKGKLAWKVEFAARWHAFDIRFEAYGKDIMESVKINDWVVNEILGYAHPLHAKYEMFLDKGGKKISKSAGNVITPQVWLKYGTPESLLLLLYKRITGTRHVSIDDIPILMDEYDLYENIYFGLAKEDNLAKLTKMKGIYEYVNHLKPPKHPSMHVPYRLLVQQASLFSKDDQRLDKIYSRLAKYRIITVRSDSLTKKIQLASNWADDRSYIRDQKTEIELHQNHIAAISQLIETLRSLKGHEQDPNAPKELQSKVFEIARENNIEIKDFFTLLYRILVNSEKGPRIANYALDLGIDRTCSLLNSYLH